MEQPQAASPGESLPPFSGHDTACPKCLTLGGVELAYRAAGQYPGFAMPLSAATKEPRPQAARSGSPDVEWMLRTCGTCGYQWVEATPAQAAP